VKNILAQYYMSMSTNPSVPFLPAFNPYSLDPSQILASMQNTNLTANVYEGTSKTINAVSDAQRLLTTEIAGVNKNIYDTIAQNAVSIERNGANAMATTERVGNQVGVSVERNGGNILATIEKVAGEGRLTTTITDAASRQAAADSARDVTRTVDRVGSEAVAATKDSFATLLGTMERTAGETRLANAIGQGQTDVKLADVRHSVLNDVNRVGSENISAGMQNFNVLNKAVTDAAWENRTAVAAGFQNLSEEHLRTKFDLSTQEANHYACQLLENQKNKEHLASHSAMQFAALISKTDGHAAGLAKQMDNHYASILLEQQKAKEVISRELADAKYEALKNKMELSKEMGECCCEIKQKVDQRTQDVIGVVDTLDRNRLRDEVNTTSNENNLLKFAEFGPWGGFGGYGGGYGYGDRGSRGRRGGRHH